MLLYLVLNVNACNLYYGGTNNISHNIKLLNESKGLGTGKAPSENL